MSPPPPVAYFLLIIFLPCIPRPPTATLFPYTTLFRSPRRGRQDEADALLDLPLVRDQGDAAGGVGAQREGPAGADELRSEEHTSELQSRGHLVCRLLLEKKKKKKGEDQQYTTDAGRVA